MRNDNNKFRRGFSRVELIIVVLVIAILVAIGIPAWQASVRSANEAAAINHLQRISTAQITFFKIHNRSAYGTFDQLSADNYLVKEFTGDTPSVDGYIYTMALTVRSGNEPPRFSVNADPQKPTGITATGRRFFYVSSDIGIITSNNVKPAGPDDPPASGG